MPGDDTRPAVPAIARELHRVDRTFPLLAHEDWTRLFDHLAEAWRRTVRDHLRLYDSMPATLRGRLEGLILVFLAEKRFVGCAGLELTDAMRVTIAAQACALVVNRSDGFFDNVLFHRILPDTLLQCGALRLSSDNNSTATTSTQDAVNLDTQRSAWETLPTCRCRTPRGP